MMPFVKFLKVDLETLGGFIDIGGAYRCITAFVMTEEFLLLSENTQMDALTFMLTMENRHRTSMAENYISEETIQRIA